MLVHGRFKHLGPRFAREFERRAGVALLQYSFEIACVRAVDARDDVVGFETVAHENCGTPVKKWLKRARNGGVRSDLQSR
jgi:hypothetical protein